MNFSNYDPANSEVAATINKYPADPAAGTTLNSFLSQDIALTLTKEYVPKVDESTPAVLPIPNYVTEATTPDRFWMTSVAQTVTVLQEATKAEAEAGTANYVKIEVGRAVAKVGLNFIAKEDIADQPNGLLKNVRYRVKQSPIKIYFMPYPTADWQTPFYSDKGENAVETAKNYIMVGNATPDVVDPSPRIGTEFAVAGSSTTDCTQFFYTMENKHNVNYNNTATYIVIRGTYIPRVTVDAKKQDPVNTDFTTATPFTFWCQIESKDPTANFVTEANGEVLCYRENPANEPANANKFYAEYTNGVSFYPYYMKNQNAATNAEKFAQKRNDFYWVSINYVSGPGKNTEDGTDPVDPKPLEQDTYVKGYIDVLNWTVVDQTTGI